MSIGDDEIFLEEGADSDLVSLSSSDSEQPEDQSGSPNHEVFASSEGVASSSQQSPPLSTAHSEPVSVAASSPPQDTPSSSCVSSVKTVEVLSTSMYQDSSLLANPVSQSILSLDDSENERPVSEVQCTAEQGTLHTGGSRNTTPGPSEEGVPDGAEPSQDMEASGRMSPYLMISKTGDVAKVTEFESPGLLYAKASSKKSDKELPVDEVAEDVLEGLEEADRDSEDSQPPDQGEAGDSYEVGLADELLPIDPDVLRDLERRAKHLAGNLNQVIGGLRNSLHAMSACSKQSVELHRESVENLHGVVDGNVKAMYVFMSKFEELHKSVTPLQQIATQIQEVDSKLRILEKQFRTT